MKQVRDVLLFCCLCLHASQADREIFAGGSMSLKFLDRQISPHKIRLTVLTAWSLGDGPCGPSCSSQDVGHPTETVRLDVINKHGVDWFGNWTEEVKYPHSHVSDTHNITQLVARSIRGQISAVNVPLQWTQEVADVLLEIDSSSEYTDISLTGEYWRALDYKGVLHSTHTELVKELKYRLQVKTYPHNRNDTGKPNNSPIVIFKPVYKVLLNGVTTIQLTTADEDEDLVRCQSDDTMTAGDLMHFHNSNIQVFQNCTIVVSGSETDGYVEGGVGAVAVRVSDYNRYDMVVQGEHPRVAGESIRSLSDMSVQFLYVTTSQTDMPEFVAPSQHSQHVFVVYMGSTLIIPLYAKPAPSNTISSIHVWSIPRLTISVDPLSADQSRQTDSVQYTTARWTPGPEDVGTVLVSAVVTDSDGSQGLDRSYIVVVKEQPLTKLIIPVEAVPYIAFLPDSVFVKCPAKATCSFPVFSASSESRKISEVELTRNPFTDVELSAPRVTTHSGQEVYLSQVTLTSGSGGSSQLCLRVIDDSGTKSKEECMLVVIESPDPCDSSPCMNGGRCERKGENFVCHCQAAYTGPLCETEADPCDSKPCQHDGQCFDAMGRLFCKCQTGFTGKFCETNIDDCKADSCSSNSVCKDGINSVQCQCQDGYTGERCQTRVSRCDYVTCSNGGQCRVVNEEPICHCPLRYTGTLCQSDVLADGASGEDIHEARFTVPTFANGSEISCNIGETCQVELYLYHSTGDIPMITASCDGDEVITDVTGPVPEVDLGLNNIFFSLLTLTPSSKGSYPVCVHIQAAGVDVDERCYSVIADHTVQVASGLLKFLPPSLRTGSTISCYSDTPCHVMFHTDRDITGQCPLLPIDGSTVVFDMSSTSALCLSDVLFLPNSEAPQTCISLGASGEERCFGMKFTERIHEGPQLKSTEVGSENDLTNILLPTILVPVCLAILVAMTMLLYSKYGRRCSKKNSVHTSKERLEMGLEEDDLKRRKKEILAALNSF